MSTEDINRFGYLFPVKEENMDHYVDKHYLSKTYVSYEFNDGGVDWFVTSIGDKIFIEANDDQQYFKDLAREPVEISWRDLLESFRAVSYNGELYYMSGCSGHVPANIYGAESSHLYPNPSMLIHVMMKPSINNNKLNIDCKTIDIDGTECALIASSPHELIHFYDEADGYDLFTAMPLGIIAQFYTHGWMNGSIYDLRMAIATSKEALQLMTDDMKQKLNGKIEDNNV